MTIVAYFWCKAVGTVVAALAIYAGKTKLRGPRWKLPRLLLSWGLSLFLPWLLLNLLLQASTCFKKLEGLPLGLMLGLGDAWKVIVGIIAGMACLGCLLALGGALTLGQRTSAVVRRTRELETLAATLRAEVAKKEIARGESGD